MGTEGPSAESFRSRLAEWYQREHRDLPWRREVSVYRTVVSEFMCQQTQIATVLPYFARWMERFPDFSALALAKEETVLKHWEGLGYYSRARNLHKLAKAVVSRPALPATAIDWQALPGIGPYTAAAISSICSGEAVAVVDGNVVRVVTRLVGDERSFKDSSRAIQAVAPEAERLLDRADPGQHNQAMMELGALVCKKRKPLCTVCPVYSLCVAGRRGDAESIPRLQRRPTVKRQVERLWVEEPDRKGILLERIPDTARRLAGQLQLPEASCFQLPADLVLERLAQKTRGIANERITETILFWKGKALPEIQPHAKEHCRLYPWEALEQATLVGPHKKWISQLRSIALKQPLDQPAK